MDPQINIHHAESFIASLARDGGEADAHLRACPRCREQYEFFRRYFAAEAQDLARPMTDGERERARELLSGGVYRLEPFQVRLTVHSLADDENPILLAALDGSGSVSRFVTVAVYAAQAIHTVVRILKDSRTGLQTLHVLSSNPSYQRCVEVGISDSCGSVLRLRTDNDGVSMLAQGVNVDWPTARLLLVTSPSDRP